MLKRSRTCSINCPWKESGKSGRCPWRKVSRFRSEHDSTLLHMAAEHRLMHAETLAYMLHQLPLEGKRQERQVSLAQSEPIQIGARFDTAPHGSGTSPDAC